MQIAVEGGGREGESGDRSYRSVAHACPPGVAVSVVVRPARASDVDAVLRLAIAGGSGLTNLPPDRDALAKRIAASEAAITSADAREAWRVIR